MTSVVLADLRLLTPCRLRAPKGFLIGGGVRIPIVWSQVQVKVAYLTRLVTKFVKNLLLLLLYLTTFVIPRSKNLWVFGAWFGHSYADNSRYLFEYVCVNEPSVRAIWLSRDSGIVQRLREAGREAYLARSAAGFWYSSRASVAFLTSGLDDVNRVGANRAIVIQLWHGIPLKKIGFDDRITTNPSKSRPERLLKRVWQFIFPYTREGYDYVISPSEAISERFASAFGIDRSKVIVTGYPRTDVILGTREEPPFLKKLMRKWNVDRVVAYLPTHRGEGRREIDLLAGLDMGRLRTCLLSNRAVMVIKMHYYHRFDTNRISEEGGPVYWITEEDLEDVNLLLPHVDVLITDYSSVFYDFLLLNRPIIFAPFDLYWYNKEDREFYEDYDAATPGPKCRDWRELIETMDEVLKCADDYAARRVELCKRVNRFADTDNCRRVTEFAKSLLERQVFLTPRAAG